MGLPTRRRGAGRAGRRPAAWWYRMAEREGGLLAVLSTREALDGLPFFFFGFTRFYDKVPVEVRHRHDESSGAPAALAIVAANARGAPGGAYIEAEKRRC